jgi:putative membrane protein
LDSNAMPKPETRPVAAPPRPDPVLMEADRNLLMMVNTSLTLIGFGFTINEIFGNAKGNGRMVNADLVGRILGLSLLSLGLILLGFGIHWHAGLVRQQTGRSGWLHLRASRQHHSPIATVAVLLLAIGLLTMGVAVFGMIWND